MPPIIYFLFLLGFTYAIAKLNTAKNIQKLDWKSYFLLLKNLLSYQIDQDKEKLQEVFMRTMVDLGKEAVKNKKPMASYYLPNGKKVVVITDPQLLDQLYHPKNVQKIAQTNLLKRLDAIMGPNFMTLPTHSPYHNDLRAAIYQRNEKKKQLLGKLVREYFEKLVLVPKERSMSEIFDKLSRCALLSTYFGEMAVEPFEKLYQEKPGLTKKLMASLFDLHPPSKSELHELVLMRQEIFQLGINLIDMSPIEIIQEESWFNRLTTMKLKQKQFAPALEKLKIQFPLQANDMQKLLQYAAEHQDSDPLASAIRDAINESLFIPLLGFEATATTAITVARYILNDKRIRRIVKQELNEWAEKKEDETLVFHACSPFPSKSTMHFSYTQAVIHEVLRLYPPAPIIPEEAMESIHLSQEEQRYTIDANSLILIPAEVFHGLYPEIELTAEGRAQFGKDRITANSFFPERFCPTTKQGEMYNINLFKAPAIPSESAGIEGRPHKNLFISFKKGARFCPGWSFALTEIFFIVKEILNYQFTFEGERELEFATNYARVLQRPGGEELVRIERKDGKQASRQNSKAQSKNKTVFFTPTEVEQKPMADSGSITLH